MGLVSSSSEYRKLNYTVSTSLNGFISKMLLGEYGDLFPIEFNGSSSTFWADGSWVNPGSCVARRAYVGGSSQGGAACLNLDYGPSDTSNGRGSRLLYRGNIEVIEDPSIFIAL